MGRWTNYEEDTDRLPEGIQRTGYDDQTARYQFRDRDGNTYLGPPHEEYGALTLVGRGSRAPSPNTIISDRPGAFASEKGPPERTGSTGSATFHELLPAHLVTSSSASESALAENKSKNSSFRNVANTARRSATFVRKLRGNGRDKTPDSSVEKPQATISAPRRVATSKKHEEAKR